MEFIIGLLVIINILAGCGFLIGFFEGAIGFNTLFFANGFRIKHLFGIFIIPILIPIYILTFVIYLVTNRDKNSFVNKRIF